jgi:N-acetylglucosaminyldiphosphoundecaprenol N-acetyl-beta-D-mannosaminyltransferase
VVNFSAGSLKRAPLWVQKIGFEWLWRIKEEPTLWRRYTKDALALWSIMMFEVLPLRLMRGLSNVSRMHFAKAQIKVSSTAVSTKVKLVGAWGQPNISKLDAVLNAISSTATPVFVDLKDCSHLDSAVLGRVLILRGKRSAQGTTLELKNVSPSMQRVIQLHGVGYLLD